MLKGVKKGAGECAWRNNVNGLIDFVGLSKLFTSKKAKQAVAETFESISPNDRTIAVLTTSDAFSRFYSSMIKKS